jgi:hypothetical protein
MKTNFGIGASGRIKGAGRVPGGRDPHTVLRPVGGQDGFR